MRRPARDVAIALLTGLLASLSSSCAGDVASSIRQHTYPPDFRYFTKQELENTMWQLASLVSQLDDVTDDDSPQPIGVRRERADALLGEMQRASRSLGPGGWPSNHPVIGPNVEKFRLDVAAARRAVSFDPPNFQLAGSISDACLHCHARR